MNRSILIAAAIAAVTLAAIAADTQQPTIVKEKTILFNGTDLAGWKLVVEDPNFDVSKNWKVKDGVVMCGGRPNGYMRTENDYADYKLHVEWRWVQKPGNSGVLVHTSLPDKVWPKSIECQLQAENAGDFWVIGGTEFAEHAAGGERVRDRNVKKLHDSSEKPAGEWNSYDIICKGDQIRVLVNGQEQNVATRCNVTSGKICLQSEGAAITLRNIYLQPAE